MNAAELREALDSKAMRTGPQSWVARRMIEEAAREWLAVLEGNTLTLSDLFIVCSHGRRSAHGVRPTGNPGDWCPGGRPVTLEDLEALGERFEWCAFHNRRKLDCPADEVEGVIQVLVIPLPQMVAGESL